MKSILLSGTAAVLLLTASGAFAAQPDDHQGGHPDTHAGGAADTHAGGDTHMSGPDGQNNTMNGGHGAMGDHGAANNTTKTHTTTHRTRHTTTHTTSTTHDNDNHGNNGFDHNGSNDNAHNDTHANNGATHPHGTVDARIRITVNATHHFHAPAYRAPRGYVYRRYNVGERLDPAFYARDYWLTDYATYDLIAPPEGYTWIRFGPDAILIDEDTGETVQVQYGVFD